MNRMFLPMGDCEVWTVPSDLGGQRIDRVVSVLACVSRSVARELIVSGDILLEGDQVAPSTRVPAGCTVAGLIPDVDTVPVPSRVPFEVRYEDEHLLIVEKPPGVVTHPGAGHCDDTLLNGLVERYPALLDVGQGYRYGVVHRLDRGTSGLLVVARTVMAYETLRAAMGRREIDRDYFSLTTGRPDAELGTIDAPIGRDPAVPTRMALNRGGRSARTHYELAAEWEEHSLLRVRLETGRTHQIRVHLASIGVPIVGDDTYGRAGGRADPGRVWLHAFRLSLRHPEDGRKMEIIAPLPADLVATFEILGEPSVGALPAL